MDLKNYYRRIREVEAAIAEESAILVSRATADGGRAGVLVEAPRAVAARLIAEGAADLAPVEQAEAFREEIRRLHVKEEARRAAARIQVTVVSEAEARALSDAPGPEDRRQARRRDRKQ